MFNKELLILLILVPLLNYGQKIKASKFGKGIINFRDKNNEWGFDFTGRIQLLTKNSWNKEGLNFRDSGSNSGLRRARLKFGGFGFSQKITYYIELGLSENDMLETSKFVSNLSSVVLDAWIKWNFYKNFSLLIGQSKLPGNIERIISSGKMALVDRSILNREFNIDRDIGLKLMHKFKFSEKFYVKETFALSQGEGRSVISGNLGGYQYTTRLEFLPFGLFKNNGDYVGDDISYENNFKLNISATYDFNDNAVKSKSNMGEYLKNDLGYYKADIKTFFINTHLKYRGLSLMGEYADRNSADPFARNSDNTLTGDVVKTGSALNLHFGYVLPSKLAISARYTSVEFDKLVTSNTNIKQYTLGVSKYILNHKLKFQSDLTFEESIYSVNSLFWRLQLEIHF